MIPIFSPFQADGPLVFVCFLVVLPIWTSQKTLLVRQHVGVTGGPEAAGPSSGRTQAK
jgi:hypothetical protein